MIKNRNDSSNYSLSNSKDGKSKRISSIIKNLKKFNNEQISKAIISPKEKYRETYKMLAKKYLLFFELSVMKNAFKEIQKNKWKKLYRKIRTLSISRAKWEILCYDVLLLNKMQICTKERKKLTLKRNILYLYTKHRIIILQKEYDHFLLNKKFKKWQLFYDIKMKTKKMISQNIHECLNCYFSDLSVKAAQKIQHWYKQVQFYRKLDDIYNLNNLSTYDQDRIDQNFLFGNFDLLTNDTIKSYVEPLSSYFLHHFSIDNVYDREVKRNSSLMTQTISNSLSLIDLITLGEANSFQSCKNLLHYKFVENTKTNEANDYEESQEKKNIFRSKKNEVINNQLKPMKMKINCNFKQVMFSNEYVQPLLNYKIHPDVKSPNDFLIIERTELLEERRDPKFIFHQRRYRSQIADSDCFNSHMKYNFTFDTPKKERSKAKKQIFYTPKKISPDKIAQYNREKKGVCVKSCTFNEFLVENLNISIPLRFSDLFTAENLNIHEFEISYDPVMSQGIDNEIETIFQNVVFKPHLSFNKFAQNQLDNATYFLKFFRYIPYHLSKHQKRKFTELIDSVLCSVFYKNIEAILSADYMRCPTGNSNAIHKRDGPRYSYRNYRTKNYIEQSYDNYLKRKNYYQKHNHHNFNLSSNFNNKFNEKRNFSNEIDLPSDEYFTNIKDNSFSQRNSSLVDIDESLKVIFCDESQISTDDNEFLIDNDVHFSSRNSLKKTKKLI